MKVRTKKILKKRFKITAKGKIVHQTKGVNHLLSKRDSSRKNRDRKSRILNKTFASKIVKGL